MARASAEVVLLVRITLFSLLAACATKGPGDDTDAVATDPTSDSLPSDVATSDSDSDSDSDSTDADNAGGAFIELGTGDNTGHVAIADGADAVMVQGGQGGWHVWGSARVCGVGEYVRHAYRIYDVQTGTYIGGLGERDEAYRQNTVLVMEPDRVCGTISGLFGYLIDPSPIAEGDADRPPEVYTGCELRLEMSFASADQTKVAEGSVTIIAQADPVNQANYVLGRCVPK